MKKAFKIIAVVLILLVIGIVALPFFFQDRIIEEIKSAANESLNAKVDFGDASFSLIKSFPNLSVGLEELTVMGVDSFADLELANIGEFTATVDLMSLFGDQIQVKSVLVEDADIHISVLESGLANYDIAKTDSTNDSSTEESSEGGFAMQLQRYELSNANFVYDDRSLPMLMTLQGFNHEGKGDFTDVQFVLNTNSKAESVEIIYDGVRYIDNATAEIDAAIEMNTDQMKFVLSENKIKLNALNLEGSGWVEMPGEDIDMDLAFASRDTDIKQIISMIPAAFAQDISGVKASGMLTLEGFIKGTYNDNSMPGFGVDLKIADGFFHYPDLPEAVENIAVEMKIDAADGNNLDAMVIDIPVFKMNIANNPVDAKLNVTKTESDPTIDCEMKALLDLSNLSKVVPLEENEILTGMLDADLKMKGSMTTLDEGDYENFMADGHINLTNANISSEALMYDTQINEAVFNFSPKHIDMTTFDGKFGESKLQATGKIHNYLAYALRDELLSGSFNLTASSLDLNDFMTEDSEAEGNTETEDAGSVIEVPGNINFDLYAAIGTLIYDDIEMTNVKGNANINDRVASMKGLTMNMLDGTVVVDGKYDSKDSSKPMVDFIFDITNMDIQKTSDKFNTVEKLAPIAKACQGSFSTRMEMKALLDQNMEPIEDSFYGKGNLSSESVYVEKLEPLNKIASTLGIQKLAEQKFEKVKLSFAVEDGKAFVNPFVVKLDGMDATIAGSTRLSDQEMDYSVKMDVPFEKFPASLVNQSNSLIGKLNSKLGTSLSVGDKVPINLKITGTLNNPNVISDQGDVIKSAGANIKEQAVDAIKQELQQNVDQSKDEARAKAQAEADKIVADAKSLAGKQLESAKKAAADAKQTAYDEAQKVENSAKNILEKAAKKIAADTMRKEADKLHDKAVGAAQKKHDQSVAAAQKKADDLMKTVE